jgi:hypothetical protein
MVVDDAAAEGKPQDAVKAATDDAAKAGAEALGAETQEKPLSPPPYMFRCPCHQSSFLLDGEKAPPEGGKANPSPRGMDHLPPPALTPDGNPNTEQAYVFADADGKKSVYVRYQEYFTGRSEKIAKDL